MPAGLVDVLARRISAGGAAAAGGADLAVYDGFLKVGRSPMAASEELARRVVEAGRSCSLTGAVLEERSRLGPRSRSSTSPATSRPSALAASRRSARRCSGAVPCPRRRPSTATTGRRSRGPRGWAARTCSPSASWGGARTWCSWATSARGRRTWRRRCARWRARGGSRLRRARDEGRLDREAAQIGRARLLVIDELGFLPLDADGARLVFQVFADAYEAQLVVITTNLEFSRWGSAFGDDQMAAAVIDRIVHHGRLVQFRGESYRVRHALMQEG